MPRIPTIPADALAVPSTKDMAAAHGRASEPKREKKTRVREEKSTEKTRLSNAELADLLGLGRSRRKVNKRAWGGKWDADQIGQLVRSNADFANRFFAILAFDTTPKAARFGPLTKKEAKEGGMVWLYDRTMKAVEKKASRVTLSMIRNAWVYDMVTNDEIGRSGRVARVLAQEFAGISNESKVHPIKVSEIVLMAGVNQALADGGTAAEALLQATQDLYHPTRMIGYARTLRKAEREIGRSSASLLRAAATSLRAMDLFAGWYASPPLRAWRRRAGSDYSVGVEVEAFTYMIPSSFDERGDPAGFKTLTHITAGSRVEDRIENTSNPLPELAGLLSLTPAGKLWLCAEATTRRGVFLATDRKPSRKVFLTNERSIDDSVVNKVPAAPLVGFVI